VSFERRMQCLLMAIGSLLQRRSKHRVILYTVNQRVLISMKRRRSGDIFIVG
jgi:hypothetical protein